jgi:hypothetical protein
LGLPLAMPGIQFLKLKATRRRQLWLPLAMPGKIGKFLKIKATRRRQLLLPLAMPDKIKQFLNETDATPSAFAIRVTSRLFI